MNDMLEMMEQDVQDNLETSVEKLDQEGLNSVAGLARAIRGKEDIISHLEEELKANKRELLKLTDEDMPAMLAEIGISKFSLDDGSEVIVKSTYGASIRVDNRPQAFEWLRNPVACQFGRGEDDKASAFASFAEKEGFFAEQKTEIHPQTLRAFVKERVEAGEEFPMELFGAWVGQKATIKKGKM